MIKNVLIASLILVIISAAGLFIYRYQIIQYSADKIIRGYLPDYIRIEKVSFDARSGKVILTGFRILNPAGFSGNYMMEIGEISCGYRMRGKSLSDGFEIFDPVFRRPLLNIERLSDGRLNLSEMQAGLGRRAADKTSSTGPGTGGAAARNNGLKPSDIVKIPESFSLENGKIIFMDKFRLARPHILSFENVDGVISIKFDDSYSKVLKVGTSGEGDVNSNRGEVMKWDIKLDPTAARLTMSSRFEISGVEITPFEPYYDRYSPLVFKKGKFSGTLIFDFDNGNIGSSNEVHLKDFRFYVKQGYENAQFWETSVPDLVKYFSSPYGEIVFDFKIKGDMQNPQFYLGPISKQALTSMAVDKISSAIESMSNTQGQGGAKSDLDKAKEYIDLFRGMIKKQ